MADAPAVAGFPQGVDRAGPRSAEPAWLTSARCEDQPKWWWAPASDLCSVETIGVKNDRIRSFPGDFDGDALCGVLQTPPCPRPPVLVPIGWPARAVTSMDGPRAWLGRVAA